MASEAEVRAALSDVIDPELGFSIVDLGLVRAITFDASGSDVTVHMTLTSPMCPIGPELVQAATLVVQAVPTVQQGKVELVWDPPWDPRTDATDDVKAAMGFW